MKLKMKVQKGDGSSYDTFVEVDDEVGKEMLKRDDVEPADKPKAEEKPKAVAKKASKKAAKKTKKAGRKRKKA